MQQNRNQIFEIYLDDFSSFKKAKELKNPNFIATDEVINESLQQTKSRFVKEIPNIILNEEEKQFVINKIKSIYSIYQEEGDVILGDYEHDYDWYKNFLESDDCQTYHWDRYKNHLTVAKHFPKEVIKVLEEKTLFSLMSYLGNPKDDSAFSVRGLVVGDVQSGKTSNYLGLVTKAADAGYKVIFILTGTIESLRKQTQQRVEEGFIGWDSFNGVAVGVGRGDPTPKAFTSRGKDFVGTDNQNTTYKLSNYSTEPMIFVLKKNVSVLKKVYSSLRNINTTASQTKINYPALVIDDEADNASINTNKPDNDPTKINKYIRSLLSLFTRSSYVGFTATPFANVFISYDKEDEMLKDDLFPRDFIYALKSPSNYCGPKKYFVDKNDNIQFIEDSDENVFPMKHKKEWDGDKLFDSLYEALRTFLLANAIRDIRDVEKIMSKSIDALRKELPGQTLNKDFVMKYIDEASKINEEDIQDIWVKLLVQENKSSGSISKRTLDIVKNLYPAEAKLFESIAKYSLSNGTIHDCFCNKFSFIDISKLQDIGLMKSSDTIEQTITIDGNNPVPFCRIEGNTIFIIKNTSNTIEKISYKCHLLTNEGVELKSALGISIDKNDYLDYCRQIKQAKNQKNLMCSAHKINYFSSGQVNYEINDIL